MPIQLLSVGAAMSLRKFKRLRRAAMLVVGWHPPYACFGGGEVYRAIGLQNCGSPIKIAQKLVQGVVQPFMLATVHAKVKLKRCHLGRGFWGEIVFALQAIAGEILPKKIYILLEHFYREDIVPLNHTFRHFRITPA
ncbi:MAG: hypothetical protein HC844_02475 [Tabrizicola sp.]|nr:hypothetical protein [Tabrizicola sp.]